LQEFIDNVQYGDDYRHFKNILSGACRALGAFHCTDNIRFQPNDILGKRYKIIKQVASGGFSRVFSATDLQTGKIVALKLSTHPYNTLMVVLREAAILSRLKGVKGVIQMRDFGEFDFGEPSVEMVYIVEDYMSRLNDLPLKVPEIKRFMRGMLNILSNLHNAGFINADIKRSNILIPRGENGRPDFDNPVLCDFGLALSLSSLKSGKTKITSQFYGSLDCMAPEIAQLEMGNKRFTPVIDIYSLGVAFNEVLKFRKDSDNDSEEFQSLQRIVNQMIDKSPDKRGTVESLLKMLDDMDPPVNNAVSQVEVKPALEKMEFEGNGSAVIGSALALDISKKIGRAFWKFSVGSLRHPRLEQKKTA
jgi:serine/threonine protein kinase